MKIYSLILGIMALAITRPSVAGEQRPQWIEGSYRGWPTLAWTQGPLKIHIAPELGGRVIQCALGEKEFFWVNPKQAGKKPPASGLDQDGGWLNYGGDKLWPAPQGWENETQWPGPPDAVLDGQPYRAEILGQGNAVRLTSGDDPRSGIRFSRTIRPMLDRCGVRIEVTMTNTGASSRRWGIWAHTQLDAAKPGGSGYNSLMKAYCPLNPQSRYSHGYRTIFGDENNPSFRTDIERKLVCVDYQYIVGKIGVDSSAGWVATVDGACGSVFVQRFTFEPEKEYPDGASVEFWHNGVGRLHAYNKEMVMATNPDENPYIFESEVLSPMAQVAPGGSYTWNYEWYAANIGGDYPVIDCNEAGVISEPLRANRTADAYRVTGRMGVFMAGKPLIQWRDAHGKILGQEVLSPAVTPQKPLVMDVTLSPPAGARVAGLMLQDGQTMLQLAKVALAQ